MPSFLIVPRDAALIAWMIDVTALVAELRSLREDQSRGQPRGTKNCPGNSDCTTPSPLALWLDFLLQVNGNVKDSARDFAHKLLPVDAQSGSEDHGAHLERMRTDYPVQRSINAASNKVFFTIGLLAAATTRITVQLYVHNLYTFNRGVIKRKIA